MESTKILEKLAEREKIRDDFAMFWEEKELLIIQNDWDHEQVVEAFLEASFNGDWDSPRFHSREEMREICLDCLK